MLTNHYIEEVKAKRLETNEEVKDFNSNDLLLKLEISRLNF